MMTNVNHQALKSLSCFAVLTFFSTSQMCTYECFSNTNAMNVLYFLSIVSKPLFFIIMGYMDEVENLTLSNILFKIKAIIIIMLFLVHCSSCDLSVITYSKVIFCKVARYWGW